MTVKNPLLAKIHIAKKELGLDDETYRSILFRVTGKESAAKCRYSQLTDVLNEFKALGWKPAKNKKSYRNTTSKSIKKIYAMWGRLRELGAVKSSDKTALDAFVKKYTGIDSVQWLNDEQARKVIEILKKWTARVEG